MFWAAGTLATQADHMPRHWMARIIAVLWMFTAVVFVAFYTAQLTASLTAQQIRGSINGPQDLVGRHVGTTRASMAAAYLSEKKAQVREFVSIDAVYDALLDKQAMPSCLTHRRSPITQRMTARDWRKSLAVYSTRKTTASSSQPIIRCASR